MKFSIIILLISFLIGCATGSKQKEVAPELESDKISLDKNQLEKILLGRYQAIAGAWYINKNCNILNSQDSQNLEKYVGDLNVYAQHNRLAPTKHLLLMQKNARLGASLDVYASCGSESKQMVSDAYKLASMLHKDLIQ